MQFTSGGASGLWVLVFAGGACQGTAWAGLWSLCLIRHQFNSPSSFIIGGRVRRSGLEGGRWLL